MGWSKKHTGRRHITRANGSQLVSSIVTGNKKRLCAVMFHYNKSEYISSPGYTPEVIRCQAVLYLRHKLVLANCHSCVKKKS